MILFAVVYVCELWSLAKQEYHRLKFRTFENICREERKMKGTWRKFHSFYFLSNFINLIKYKTSWAKNIGRSGKSVIFQVIIQALPGRITKF